MKMKHLVAVAGMVAFVSLCSFKANTTKSDLLISKSKQVKQEAFNKMFLTKDAAANISAPKHTSLLLVLVFAVAVHTPALGGTRTPREPSGELAGTGNDSKTRMKGLDAK